MATQYDISFAYMGPKLWNMLQTYLRVICKLDEFKRKFAGFVLFLPNWPPVPGYSVAGNRNGLVEVVPIHGHSALEGLLQNVAGPPPAGCARDADVT